MLGADERHYHVIDGQALQVKRKEDKKEEERGGEEGKEIELNKGSEGSEEMFKKKNLN